MGANQHWARDAQSMDKLKSNRRSICFAGFIAIGSLLGGCQEPSQQTAAAKPSSTVATPATSQSKGAPLLTGISVYDPQASVKPISSCNLESVGSITLGQQQIKLESKESNTFRGWIAASAQGQPSYRLRFEDRSRDRYLQLRIKLTAERPDVVTIDAAAPLISGFGADLPANSLPAGDYHVYLAAASGNLTYICDNGRQIRIEP